LIRYSDMSMHGRNLGDREGMPTTVSDISFRFVLWEAVSQAKYCCPLRVKYLAPPGFWVSYATVSMPLVCYQWSICLSARFAQKQDQYCRI